MNQETLDWMKSNSQLLLSTAFGHRPSRLDDVESISYVDTGKRIVWGPAIPGQAAIALPSAKGEKAKSYLVKTIPIIQAVDILWPGKIPKNGPALTAWLSAAELASNLTGPNPTPWFGGRPTKLSGDSEADFKWAVEQGLLTADHAPAGRWSVSYQKGGGQLRSAFLLRSTVRSADGKDFQLCGLSLATMGALSVGLAKLGHSPSIPLPLLLTCGLLEGGLQTNQVRFEVGQVLRGSWQSYKGVATASWGLFGVTPTPDLLDGRTTVFTKDLSIAEALGVFGDSTKSCLAGLDLMFALGRQFDRESTDGRDFFSRYGGWTSMTVGSEKGKPHDLFSKGVWPAWTAFSVYHDWLQRWVVAQSIARRWRTAT